MSERLVEVASKPRHVVIAGGGPAGLKVAEIAARRGHRVTLLERSSMLGGQVRLAALQPEHAAIGEVTAYLEAAIVDRGVAVMMGVEATPETLLALAPDVVVVATGSEPNLPLCTDGDTAISRRLGRQVRPDIEGLDRACVVSSDQVLAGKKILSGRVVVIDNNGHWEAAGTAEFLADAGCSVTVIASHMMVGEGIEAGNRTLFYRRAAIKGIELIGATSLVAIEDRRVRISEVFFQRRCDRLGQIYPDARRGTFHRRYRLGGADHWPLFTGRPLSQIETGTRICQRPHRTGRGLRGTALGPEHHSRSLRIGASSVGKDMTLKIAFNTWVYSSFPVWVPSYPLTDTIERIAAIGYDGIEIGAASPHAYPDYLSRQRRHEIKTCLEANALALASMLPAPGGGPGFNAASPLPEERANTLDQYCKVVDLCADLGGSTVIYVAGWQIFGTSRQQAWEWSRQALEKIADHAASRGVTIVHRANVCRQQSGRFV